MCVNKVLLEQTYYLCIVYDGFCITNAELNSCNRPHGPQSLKYLLFSLLQGFWTPALVKRTVHQSMVWIGPGHKRGAGFCRHLGTLSETSGPIRISGSGSTASDAVN